jgi:hypothetical protein
MVERKNDKKAMVHKQYKMIKILATRTPLKTETKGKTVVFPFDSVFSGVRVAKILIILYCL